MGCGGDGWLLMMLLELRWELTLQVVHHLTGLRGKIGLFLGGRDGGMGLTACDQRAGAARIETG